MSGLTLSLAAGGLLLVIGLIALVAKLSRSAGRAEAVKGIADEQAAADKRVADVSSEPRNRRTTGGRLRDGTF